MIYYSHTAEAEAGVKEHPGYIYKEGNAYIARQARVRVRPCL